MWHADIVIGIEKCGTRFSLLAFQIGLHFQFLLKFVIKVVDYLDLGLAYRLVGLDA